MIQESWKCKIILTPPTDCFTYFKKNIIPSLSAGFNHLVWWRFIYFFFCFSCRAPTKSGDCSGYRFSTVLLQQSVPLYAARPQKTQVIRSVMWNTCSAVYKTWIRPTHNLSLTQYLEEQQLHQIDLQCTYASCQTSPCWLLCLIALQ